MANINEPQVKYSTQRAYRGSIRFYESGDILVRPFEPCDNKEDRMHLLQCGVDEHGNHWDIYESKHIIKLSLTVSKKNLEPKHMWANFATSVSRVYKYAMYKVRKLRYYDSKG